jgi:hypothetical protein
MRFLLQMLLLTVCLPLLALNAKQAKTKGAMQDADFLIDPSKPYLYLEVDHIGPRRPLREGEPNMGIWLHLKNNCRLPVVIIASGVLADRPDEALWVGDEVVPNRPPTGTESTGSGIGYQPEQQDLADIFLSPNVNEAEVRGAEDALRGTGKKESVIRPHGYNDGHQPGVQVLKLVPVGGEISFSLPINHVSESWHLEIPFRLALPNKGRIRPPYSYVAFYQEDLKDNHGNAAPPTPTTH